MEYGVFALMPRRDLDQSPAEVIEGGIEQAVLADQLGFDFFWIAEHHFSNYGMVPSPLYLAVKIAERTRRVRIGSAVLVLPFYNGLRLAEDIALVDVLTDGRLVVGVGRGYQPYEFHRFGLSIDDSRRLFDENMEILHRALTQDTFSFQGHCVNIPETSLQIRPLQQPHPPIWVTGYTPETMGFVVQHNYALISQYGYRPIDFVRTVRRLYDERLVAAGKDPEDARFALMIYPYIAESRRDALEWIDQHLWTYRPSMRFRNGLERVLGGIADATPLPDEPSADELLDRLVVGDPETCIARIQRLVNELRPTQLILDVGIGGMDQRRVLRCIRRLAEEVLPHVSTAVREST